MSPAVLSITPALNSVSCVPEEDRKSPSVTEFALMMLGTNERSNCHESTSRGLAMEKWLSWGSMGVGGILLIVFILDIALGFPFAGFWGVDIVFIVACLLVIYLAWSSSRE